MRIRHNCKGRICKGSDLSFVQLSSQKVTKTPLFALSALKPIESYNELYPTLGIAPEIPYFKKYGKLTEKERNVDFPSNTVADVFNLDYANSRTTILNPVNAETFMRQIEAKVPLSDLSYRYNIKRNDYEFYTFLYKYLKFFIAKFANFEQLGGTPKDRAFSQLTLLAAKNAIGQISNNIEYTLYARLLYVKFTNEKITCRNVFEASGVTKKKIDSICKDEAFNLVSLESIEPWMMLENPNKNGTAILKSKFSLVAKEIMGITTATKKGTLWYHLSDVKVKAAAHYKCMSNKECSVNELTALQWGSSGVTRTVADIYKSPLIKNTESLQDWILSSGLEPQEFYVYAKKNKKEQEDVKIEMKAAERFVGEVFAKQFEALKLAIYLKDYKKLEDEYKIKYGYLLHGYIKHIIENNLLSGPYNNRTARELTWGFYDQFLTDAVFLLNKCDRED